MDFSNFPTQVKKFVTVCCHPCEIITGVFDRKQTGTQVTGGLPFTNPNRKVLSWNQFYFLK